MQTITLQKYQTRARNFYLNHCGSENCGFHGHLATHSMSIWPPIPR